VRRERGIQQSPVLVGVDDQGRLTVSSRETAYKNRHLRRDPWVQLCVLPDGFFGAWAYVEGKAEDGDEYRAGMQREQRVLIRVTPLCAGPDRQG
jgi:hypothetical protein